MLFVIYMPVSAYRGDKFELRWKAAVFRFENKQPCTNECPAQCL